MRMSRRPLVSSMCPAGSRALGAGASVSWTEVWWPQPGVEFGRCCLLVVLMSLTLSAALHDRWVLGAADLQ